MTRNGRFDGSISGAERPVKQRTATGALRYMRSPCARSARHSNCTEFRQPTVVRARVWMLRAALVRAPGNTCPTRTMHVATTPMKVEVKVGTGNSRARSSRKPAGRSPPTLTKAPCPGPPAWRSALRRQEGCPLREHGHNRHSTVLPGQAGDCGVRWSMTPCPLRHEPPEKSGVHPRSEAPCPKR